ncbi:MAG: hypothetical protein FWD31_08820 [Planctomycetaceae bacterium]|nr:hypothetical protein [Planctomycetaceae bacterium]
MKTTVFLPITQITLLDPSLRIRLHRNDDTIMQYSEQMESPDDLKNFPPVDVYFDGIRYWLADGYLRLEAAKRAGYDSVWVTINMGTSENAFWAAVVANSRHGLFLTRAERKRVVEIILKRWPDRSNRMIAEAIGVSDKSVARIRNELAEKDELIIPEKRRGLDGKMHPSKKARKASVPCVTNLSVSVSNTPDAPSDEKHSYITDKNVSDSEMLTDLVFAYCADDIEGFFLYLFDEIVRRSGNDVGKKLLKSIFDRIVSLR